MENTVSMEAWMKLYGMGLAFWANTMFRGPMVVFASSMVNNPYWYYGGVIPEHKNTSKHPK